MPHTHTTKRRKPERRRTRNGIDGAGDILYAQKGKYYIRGITNSPLLQKDLVPRSKTGKRKGTRNEDDLLVPR